MPDDTWRDISKLNEFVSWVKSTNTSAATNENLAESVTYKLNTTVTLTNYTEDTSYSVVAETSNGQATGYYNITFTKDTPAYRLTKFRAEAPDMMEIESASYYYLFTLFFLMIDSRAKNMFFGFHGSTTNKWQYITRKVVFEPYDMDTALGTNNSGVLKFGYYHLDTDTVSNIISGGEDGGSNAPVFNGQSSVLWNNFRECFRTEYMSMYRTLRANNTWTYEGIEGMYEQHQSMWPEALFNEDAYVKYIVPLVEAVTWDEDTNKYIKTDRYLTMLQGSKEQQRKWWLQNRFRYFDSMYTTKSAETSFIEMRLFNSGTLTITPAQDMYVAVRFGRGSTTQRVRATAGTPVSFSYVFNSNVDLTNEQAVVTEMESTIFSASSIADVGDLSVFYGNEFDFSRATKLRKLKLGDSSSNYSNANLSVLNVSNCFLLEEIDCRNCTNLSQPIDLGGSPLLEKAYFDGTKITSVNLVEGAPITHLHLPGTITSLILMNHSKLTDFVCPDFSHVSTLMMTGIDQDVLDPLDLISEIQTGARINIQGLDIEVTPQSGDLTVTVPTYDQYGNQTGTEQVTYTTDAEKAGYMIEQFLQSVDGMHGVTRSWNASKNQWDDNDQDSPIISGTIHTNSLTGEQIAYFNTNRTPHYPYINFSATNVSSKITLKAWDGSPLGQNGQDIVIECLNGVMQGAAPSSVARTSTAQFDFTFVGWSRNQDAVTAQADALSNVIADRVVYAAYSRTTRTYTVTWKNGNTTIETDLNVPYGTTPTYNGSTPQSEGYNSTGWIPDISPVTGDITYTASYKPLYTATFVKAAGDGGGTLQSSRFQEGSTPVFSGTTPTTTKGNTTDFTFIGWSPSIGPIYANTTYTAVFRDNRSVVIKYLSGSLDEYESTTNTKLASNVFKSMTSLKSVTAPITTIETDVFSGCTGLEYVELSGTSVVTIPANAFNGATNLTHLVLRSTTMSTLANTSVLSSTKIGKGWGTVYVPADLVATYKADATWGNYLIKPISAYPNTEFSSISDSWEQIIANNNYATDYVIGDTKVIDFGTYGLQKMELVAIDADIRADGDETKNNGKARMTWISKDLITTHNMNSSNTTSGGWEATNMRSWLKNTIKPLLPAAVQSNIVEVSKVSSTYENNSIVKDGQTTTDDVWIPSNHEVGLGTNYETTGPVYARFNSNSDRIKYYSGSAYIWWLRSADYSSYFRYVYSAGSDYNGSASYAYGVALGFCL